MLSTMDMILISGFSFFAGLAQDATDRRNLFWIISTDIQRTELDTGVTGCLDQWRSPRIG
ncbi:uncharacterized protein METZ01_LOCUS98259 [marine metagenome]|uniref:Uncharacterized protein n=1 Tax=marine metagenome TaxID=408172 RepID=A0A381VYP9_9ZZZZ